MADDATGGNDLLRSERGAAHLVGDGLFLSGNAQGGSDKLQDLDGSSVLAGDGESLTDEARGGDDSVKGGGGADTLYGDAAELALNSIGGDDVLWGGVGNDKLYGDAVVIGSDATGGFDRFVFRPGDGQDTIGDFEQGKDLIDVRRLSFDSFAELTITDDGSGSVVQLGGVNQVTVLGVTGLAAADFLFG